MFSSGVYARFVTVGSALALVVLLVSSLLPGAVRHAAADEPVITYISIEDGDVFAEPLSVIQICFEDPIDVRDLPPLDEGDFEFSLVRPNGFRVGMRIVFQANGYGVAVYPGIVEEDFNGEWTFSFTVRDRESLDPVSRTVTYEVRPGGDPILTPTPQMCPTEGTPVPSDPTGSPDNGTNGDGDEPTPDPGLDEGDDDPDLLLLSLLTIGAAGGLGVIALLGYVFRSRIGWSLHKPSQKGTSEEEHH